MQPVALDEDSAQCRRQRFADGRLATAGNAHHHDGRCGPNAIALHLCCLFVHDAGQRLAGARP
jgi:hypothetical protein